MNTEATINELNLLNMKEKIPMIKEGYTVKVTQKIKEGDKERLQMFEGLVIKTHRKGDINSTITVRKISNGIGVEKIFALHAPNIVDLEIMKIAKVRRSKLYYMRERSGKSARLKETQITKKQKDQMFKVFKKSVEKTEEKEIQDTEKK
jgi:large subunit ribosomal protein L19